MHRGWTARVALGLLFFFLFVVVLFFLGGGGILLVLELHLDHKMLWPEHPPHVLTF